MLTGGPTTLGSTAQTLADGGYIISAFGSDQTGNFIMIGTKVVGDQIPRALLIIAPGASPVPISDDGYATVADTGVPTSGYPMWIAEK